MPNTTTWSIAYPNENSTLTPLNSHFENLANTADTALSSLKSNIRGTNTTATLATLTSDISSINTRLGLNLQVSTGTPTGVPINNGSEGSLCFDTQNDILYIYINSAWKILYKNDTGWTPYTPTVSGGTPAWALGSTNPGTIVGSYSQVGKTVHFKGSLKIGSGMTIGADSLTVTLPVTSVAADSNGAFALTGSGRCSLTGFAGTGTLAVTQTSTTTFQPQVIMTSGTLGNATTRSGIDSTVYTKTAGNLIIWQGTYEAA